jgi:gliding motility-associated-like protein
MKYLKLISLLLLSVISSITIFSQSNSCSTLEPICTDVGLNFPAQTGVANASTTDPGNAYGCLGSSPNPTWYYMEVATAGGIDMNLSAGSDIDFALWGPFSSLANAQANCNSYGSAIDCSYSTAATENVNVPGAQVGEVYVLLITNYASVSQQITLTQTGGTGATDCSIVDPCFINFIDANVSACDAGTFDITGQITFVDPPTVGTLTVTNCSGNQQVFNAPFNSPINYAINGVVADATAGCTVTATFSDDPTCTISTGTFTEPICTCFMTLLDAEIGVCNGVTNSFDITGTIEFVNPPTNGTLTVSNCSGDQQVFNAPFASPQVFTIGGITADATPGCTVSAVFSADPTCTLTTNTYTEPASCLCPAYAGTTNSTLTGFGTNNYILCDGDQIDIVSNGDNVEDPLWVDPGLMYAIYTCPPTPGVEPGSDPCYSGFVVGGPLNLTDVNVGGSSGGLFAAIIGAGIPIAGNTVYYAPMTATDFGGLLYDPTCVDVGPVTAVTYLEPLVISGIADCQTGTVTVTISGGYPELLGGSYSISNILPATVSVSPNPLSVSGGVVTISGLQDGDMYSFDVTDDNGCPIAFSGGPFVALPVSDAGADDTECSFSYGLNAVASVGNGAWTGAGVTFSNANSPTSNATVTSAGSYTMTWTEDNGSGCTDADNVTIQFSNLSYVDAVVQSTCGSADGEIALAASDGITAYQYSIDNGATFQTSGDFTGLLSGNYNVIVQDNIGCQVNGTVSVTDQGGPVINSVIGVDPLCTAGCDGSISINATGATQFSINNGVSFQGVSSFTNLCPGNYDILVTNAVGCQATSSTVLNNPLPISYSAALTDILCSGQCSGEIDVTAGGGTGTIQYSNDNGVTFGLNNLFNSLCVGNYDIVVEDANGCQVIANEPITEPAPLTIILGITNPFCNSSCDGMINSIPSGGDGNYTYTWSSGQLIPLVSSLCIGQYDLNVIDGNGCFIDTSVTLIGPAAAVISNVIEVDESCPGMCDGSLEIVASNVTQYSIDGINFVAGPIFTNLCSGIYTVYAQDVNACSTTAPAEVSSPIVVGVSVTATSPICIGGSSFLDGTTTGGTQPFTYEWADNAGAVLFATEDGNVSPVLDEVYTFTATDANGCSAATNVLVQVNDPLTLTVFGDTPICEGSVSSLSALASGGDGGPYTYSWDQGLGIGQNQTVSPNQTTVYTVTITDGCETPPISAQVTIAVNTVPSISFTGDQLSGCVPVTTNFSDNLVPAGSSCLWNFGDGGTSTQCGNPSYVYTQPGCWDVTLTITTAEGCIGSVTIPNYVCVSGYPTADFTFGPQPTTVLNPTIDFVNLSSNADLYNWTFDVGGFDDQSTIEDPQYTFPSLNPGVYEVCLEAITLDGCTDAICQNVVIDEEFIIYVPNAFTPGGNDLINNEFKPIVKGEDPLKYSFMVFNRWGELIFETSLASQGWDGKYKGLMSQQDVYVWKVICIDASSKQSHEYIGHVTLLK